MSDKKHKGDHARRAEKRAAKRAAERERATLRNPASAEKPRRVFLRNHIYIWLTLLVIVADIGVLVGFEVLGFWDNVIGSVASVLVGAFGCMCIYDFALLMTACITFGDGMVNAGKGPEGQAMIFHAASVLRLEMQDRDGRVLPEDQRVYKKAAVVFVMESGRTNRREVTRLSQKQYQKLRAALEAEKIYNVQ